VLGNVAARAADMRTIIELAKNLSQGHELANPGEKRQWVEMTTSNRQVSGKNIEIEPADWLLSLKHAASVPFGEPRRSIDRTFGELADDARHVSDSLSSEENDPLM
jgi:hypothetical protein